MSIYGNHFASVRPCTETVNLEEVFMQEMNQFDSIVNSLSILSENTEIIYEAKIDVEKIKTKIKELWSKFKAWVKETWDKIKSFLKKFAENKKSSEKQNQDIKNGKYECTFYCIDKNKVTPYLGYIEKIRFAFEYTNINDTGAGEKSFNTSQETLNNIKDINNKLFEDYDDLIKDISNPTSSSSNCYKIESIFIDKKFHEYKLPYDLYSQLDEFKDQKDICFKIYDIENKYNTKIRELEKYLNNVFVDKSVNEWKQQHLANVSLAISTDIKILKDLLIKINKLLNAIITHNFTISTITKAK